MPLEIHSFEAGPVATNAYVVIDRESGAALIIDAPKDAAEPIRALLEENALTPSALILTHSHWDHTADAAELKRLYPEMLVYIHPEDEYRLSDPMEHTIWPLPFVIEGVAADRHLHDGDTVTSGGLCFNVLHTPGHTEGGICLHDAAHGVLFVGDTLFEHSVGRTDLPGGNWEQLLDSIRGRLLPLDTATQVFPGHGPSTTIGAEREGNPFLGG